MGLLCPGAHVDQIDPWRLWRKQDKTEALYGITQMFGLLKKERIKIFLSNSPSAPASPSGPLAPVAPVWPVQGQAKT